ncbi:Heme d1 biosynthesis protein NirJ [hydrothermal vent metagenome]|uniref:Heme d1 biosynthesis protein NirJ n=1 Tax=hydrothermal vent metagenome TaxID=652676 RepID=A0A3B0XYD9_9ZZZZ
MFRISQFMGQLHSLKQQPLQSLPAMRKPRGPVVIWNLIRRCNLTCQHCYSISTDKDFPGELNTEKVFEVMDDLKAFHVPVLIISGGEPLLRDDIFEISKRAKVMGFYVGLSSNGTLITENNIRQISEVGYDYVGISIDGLRQTHDRFRRKQGAFDEAINGIRLCHEQGIKVGMRFTLTLDNAAELPDLLQLMEQEQVDKFYLSHLNYAGRGNKNRGRDVYHQLSRDALDLLFKTSWQDQLEGRQRDFVSGNNDADGVYLLQWVEQRYPQYAQQIKKQLQRWGGNSTGVNIANIDNLGNVHPDTFWWDYDLGNVKQRRFSEIWTDTREPLMAALKMQQRPLKGRCADCKHLAICNGNTRVRARQLTGDPWQEDPACYLSDKEIGYSGKGERVELRPWSRTQQVIS